PLPLCVAGLHGVARALRGPRGAHAVAVIDDADEAARLELGARQEVGAAEDPVRAVAGRFAGLLAVARGQDRRALALIGARRRVAQLAGAARGGRLPREIISAHELLG